MKIVYVINTHVSMMNQITMNVKIPLVGVLLSWKV